MTTATTGYQILEEDRRIYAVTPTGELIVGAFLPDGEDFHHPSNDWVIYMGPHAGRLRYHAHCATRTAALWWVEEYASRYAETCLEETA